MPSQPEKMESAMKQTQTFCQRRYAVLVLAAALCLQMTLPACGLAASSGINGFWRIDIEESLLVNQAWRTSYQAAIDKDQAQMRTRWAARTLAVDLERSSIRAYIGSKMTQDTVVLSVTQTGQDVHLVVADTNNREASYPMVMTLLLSGKIKTVIDSDVVMVLEKASNPVPAEKTPTR